MNHEETYKHVSAYQYKKPFISTLLHFFDISMHHFFYIKKYKNFITKINPSCLPDQNMILIIYYAGLSGMVECQTGDGSQKVEQQIQCYACGLPKVCYIFET